MLSFAFRVESDPQAYGLDISRSLSEWINWPNTQNIRTPTIERVQRVYVHIILNASPGQIVFVHVMFFTLCLMHFEELRWRGWTVRYRPLNWVPIPWPQWVYRGHRASDFEDENYRNSTGKIRMLRDLGDTRGKPGNILGKNATNRNNRSKSVNFEDIDLDDSRKKNKKRSSRIPKPPRQSRIQELESQISKLQEENARVKKQAMRAGSEWYPRESETSDLESQDFDDDGSSGYETIETQSHAEN